MAIKKISEEQYKKHKRMLAKLTDSQLKEMQKIEREAIARFSGNMTTLMSALGFLRVGYEVGWRVLIIAHHKTTIKKYESILNIDIREQFPEEGSGADRSIGLKVAKSLNKFWEIVRGQKKIEGKGDLS
ncbi:MAG: hypothetical protein JKY86_12335 [Gammaproteobacteria bacterium]|nr:hypothetical protein [Gammaproteobacteria bacterium]